MCDNKEDQNEELEVLESIYGETFNMISDSPATFSLQASSEEDEEVVTFGVDMTFTYTSEYPQEAPLYELELLDGDEDDGTNTDEFLDRVRAVIEEQIEENLGTVMVYTIVAEVQEFVNNMKDEIKQKREDETERIRLEEKEAEERKCQGTRVTVASFLEWKTNFMEELRVKELELKKMEKVNKKLTGMVNVAAVCTRVFYMV